MLFSLQDIFDGFENYREKSLSGTVIRYREIIPLLGYHRKRKTINIKQLGKSVAGKVIYGVTVGTGSINVLAWSQMHGNESTATRTFFDFLNFISEPQFADFCNWLFSKITLHYIPMLNPDGAEIVSRYNALGIDINRDAVNLVSPESEILDRVFREINPDFSLNLHDQDGWYAAGEGNKPTAISFLATVMNRRKELSEARKKAMSVIGKTANTLCKLIPGHIAKYNEEYEPRAFGDSFAARNSSVILIEAGRWKEDSEKEYIRKVFFSAFVTTLNYIAEEKYTATAQKVYRKLPENKETLLDLILRNVKLRDKYIVDIGIKRVPVYDPKEKRLIYEGKIEAVGDLSTYYGFEEYDLNGYSALSGNFHQLENIESDEFSINHFEFFRNGITTIILDNRIGAEKLSSYSFNFTSRKQNVNTEIFPGNFANFYLRNNDDNIDFIVVNGFFISIAKKEFDIPNAIIRLEE
jgi:hypothetical protein